MAEQSATTQADGAVGDAARRATEHAGSAEPRIPTTTSITGPVVGAIFALCAFAVGIVAGFFSGNDATSVVGRALLAMIVCYPVGLLVGWICQRVVSDHLRAHVEANPVPQLDEHLHGQYDADTETRDSDDVEEPLVV